MVARRSRLCALLGLAVCLQAPRALAEPLPLELEWRAPDECPSAEDVRLELERIAHVSREREPTPLVARAHVLRVQNGYFLELTTLKDGQVGKKKLFARTCAPLKEAATLVLALAFGDGIEVTDDSTPAAAPEPPAASAVPAASTPNAVERTPPPAARGLRLRFAPWVAAITNFGLLGGTSAGARVGLAVFRGHFGFETRGTLLLPTRVPSVNGIGASFDASAGAIAGCARIGERALGASGCAGLEATAIHGVSSGATRNLDAWAAHFSAVPSLALTWRAFGPVALRAEGDLGIALGRPEFYVRPQGIADGPGHLVLHRTPELSLALGLGIAVAL